MNHRLTENERGLLSAYLDGELNDVDRVGAERLLAESDDARRYLEELKAVENISASALTVPLSADTMIVATRLTGSAIKTAAGSVGMKGGILGSWGTLGIGGLVTAAAVTVGVMIWPGRQLTTDNTPSSRPPYVSGLQATPVVNLDSSSVIVPPMTAGELVTFAVDGTLPIDAARERFITVASRSADSLAVALHTGAPKEDLVRELARLKPSAIPSYDSLMRISRLVVLRSNDGAIAVSPNVPQLRLRILQSLARMESADVTQACRTRIAQAEEELAIIRAKQGVERSRESFEELVAALDGKRESPYILISTPNGELLRTTSLVQNNAVPLVVAIDLTEGPLVRIAPNAYRAIGQFAFAELPSEPPVELVAAPTELPSQTISIGAGGGPRPRAAWVMQSAPRANVARTSNTAQSPTPDQMAPQPTQPQHQDATSPNDQIPNRAAEFDELNRLIQERLMKVRERIDRMNNALRDSPRGSQEGNGDDNGGAGGDD